MNTSPDMPSSRPMTLRQHTKLTDEILEVIDQQPLNRYEVALRLTRWAENYGQEIAREARLDELNKIKADQAAYIKAISGHVRNTNSWPHNRGTGKASQAFLDWIDRRIAELTQKPPQPNQQKGE